MCLNRWQQLCQTLGIVATHAIEREFERLGAAYGEPHRVYHTAQHINECLDLLDDLEGIVRPQKLSALAMALWYHDMVYHPTANNNEQQSAAEAVIFLRANNVDIVQIEAITALIMTTRHFVEPGEMPTLAQWMVDIDLGILGAAADRFLQYERQIRQEYSWLAADVYCGKRRQVLTEFLQRPRLYHSTLFYDRFEKLARKNLLWLLSHPSLLS